MGVCRRAKPLCRESEGALRYHFFLLPGQEGGQGEGRKGCLAVYRLRANPYMRGVAPKEIVPHLPWL